MKIKIKRLKIFIVIGLVGCTSVGDKNAQDGFRHFDPPETKYQGSSFKEVWDVVSDGQYQTMPERVKVTPESLRRRKLLTDLTKKNGFLRAATRTLDVSDDYSTKDWDRHVHPNGICVAGKWIINQQETDGGVNPNNLTGYFEKGKQGLIIARISTEGSIVSNRKTKSLSLVGKIFPTLDVNETVPTASFITQDDLGGRSASEGVDGVLTIADVNMRNAPDFSVSKRIESGGHDGFLSFLATKNVFDKVDLEASVRQLYRISEAGLSTDEQSVTPKFMQINYSGERPVFANDEKLDDFRDWIIHHIQNYQPLTFDIALSSKGKIENVAKSDDDKTTFLGHEKKKIKVLAVTGFEWSQPIGQIVFDQVIAASGCDHRIHFHHPPWRHDLNDHSTETQRDNESKILIEKDEN
jgi:hypothetical protein